MNIDEKIRQKFGVGEQYIREVYEKQIKEMPTFSDNMQKTIQDELNRVIEEYKEYFKEHNEEIESDEVV